ncbi:MAG: hypothetical protein GY858_08425 [Candidatus Omnitrophica bacterium]|nr:hypothetical protein [Candidatus Omnitrophota bacterium]
MSIIYDALKKADKDPVGSASKSEVKIVKTPKKVPKKIVLPIILIGVVIFFIFHLKNQPENQASHKLTSSSRGVQRKRKPIPKKTYSKGSYILEGIIYDEISPLAVINGRMLNIGEALKQMKVTQITPTKVTLTNLDNNKKSILSIN